MRKAKYQGSFGKCKLIDGLINYQKMSLPKTQGAGEGFDPPKKVSMSETRVFGFGTTWGTTFTKVILLRMAEALLYF